MVSRVCGSWVWEAGCRCAGTRVEVWGPGVEGFGCECMFLGTQRNGAERFTMKFKVALP